MRKLLFFLFAVLMIFVMADNRCMAADVSLIDKINNHPDVEKVADNWYRIVEKDNLSNTTFDWRFNRKKIETYDNKNIIIGLRQEQNSGSTPNSNWVIEYTFLDRGDDGILDDFVVERFISIEQNGTWLRTSPNWPDKFINPQPTKEEANKVFKEELEFWKYKLNSEG